MDLRGNSCSTANAVARDAAEKALWRMMSFYDPPLADLDEATEADPGWLMPHLMKAGFLLSLTEPGLHDEAQQHLAQARLLSAEATPRERAHLEALQMLLEGRWHSACRVWDELLVEHPRDALALQWAHLWDFYRGDSASLRLRPARALPEWDNADPLHPYVLGLYAFGLEECNLYSPAEDAGRQALESEPRSPWAVHAVAHVMEMQGRVEEGSAWLRDHRPQWAVGNGFSCHLWWHKALFRLEAMDSAGALRLLDGHLSGDALQITLNRVDAASLLWRLHLLGEDVSPRCQALLADWPLDDAQAGHHAFNDLHIVLALIAAGEIGRAEAWLARCAERVLIPTDVCRSNHLVARELGLPLMRGLLAFARGDASGAADLLASARPQLQRLGGSHAQRDLIDQSLLAAAVRGGRRSLGRALLNERKMAKAMTPLTRYWIDSLGCANEARA